MSSCPNTSWDSPQDGDPLNFCLCCALQLQIFTRLWELFNLGQTFQPGLVQPGLVQKSRPDIPARLEYKVLIRKMRSHHYVHAYFTFHLVTPLNMQDLPNDRFCFLIAFSNSLDLSSLLSPDTHIPSPTP